MGASREGFDLLHKYGRYHAWKGIRSGRWRSVRIYIFRDTCTRWLCWLSGGHEFHWQPDVVNAPEELFCNWCHKQKPIAAKPYEPSPTPLGTDPLHQCPAVTGGYCLTCGRDGTG